MWQGIQGHDRIVERFRQAIAANRLASTFLFVGPPGIGKHTFARKLAQALLCDTHDEGLLDPCGTCDSCVQVQALNHPDLLLVSKPPAKSFLPVDLFIGRKEHRMCEGLCHDLSLKPFHGGKIAIIDDADLLNQEGANALLKTLEEPPPRSVLILIGTSAVRQLPTIRSRSQIVRFSPLATEVVANLLIAQGVTDEMQQALRLAASSEGSLRQAIAMADPELESFRAELWNGLAAPVLDSVDLAKRVGEFVDKAGREATVRRDRLRQVIGFAVDFYRRLVRVGSGAPVQDPTNPDLVSRLESLSQRARLEVEGDTRRLDRSLEALLHVDRNANQATLIASWLDDLAR